MIDLTIDTTAFVDLLRGRQDPQDVPNQYEFPAASHVVLGELLLGTMKSIRPIESSRLLSRELNGIAILNANASTARIYARLRWSLELQGSMIPENDLWIAAVSIQADAPLLTRDIHFRRLSELRVLEY